jgi:hypothetical protein
MRATIEMVKEDIKEAVLEKLWQRGFQLAKGKELDWRMRPSMHVLAEVEPLQTNAETEGKWLVTSIDRLRDIASEMTQYGYKVGSKLLIDVVMRLQKAEDDKRNAIVHKEAPERATIARVETYDAQDDDDSPTNSDVDPPPIPAPLPRRSGAKPITKLTEFSEDVEEVLARSRQMLKGESLIDPNLKK